MQNHNHSVSQGFALLITLMVVSVVVSVTLAIVELSLKQLELSVDSTDSELAFQAANAGLECARFTRRSSGPSVEVGANITFRCFGATAAESAAPFSLPLVGNTVNDGVYYYQTELTWGTAPRQRCSEIRMVAMVVAAPSPGVRLGATTTAGSVKNLLPGYPYETKFCGPGGRCTVASVTGYSSSCANKTSASTRSREILLEF